MFRVMLKGKIHRATVTEANLYYKGSVTIDTDLLKAADILLYEKVQIVDINNGERLETYVIEGTAGSGIVCLNGAAARLVHEGDTIIVLSYFLVDEKETSKIKPKIVYVDKDNKITSIENYVHPDDDC
ncbi:MAG: aspartate 1-decarboxylase [Actinobacteria bacterium]|nr:aspartate 1-decarboxylase [Actinomycetota bacterium]